MLKVSETYPSTYLNAADLQGQRVQVQIQTVDIEEVSDFRDKNVKRKRLMLGFVGKTKKMLLGSQNANRLADVFGDDAGSWVGKSIELWAERQLVAGAMKDVLVVGSVKPVTTAEAGPGF